MLELARNETDLFRPKPDNQIIVLFYNINKNKKSTFYIKIFGAINLELQVKSCEKMSLPKGHTFKIHTFQKAKKLNLPDVSIILLYTLFLFLAWHILL